MPAAAHPWTAGKRMDPRYGMDPLVIFAVRAPDGALHSPGPAHAHGDRYLRQYACFLYSGYLTLLQP